jgi:hypothetical protein
MSYIVGLLVWGCSKPAEVFMPDVGAATFVDGVDHPLLPMPVGATWVYEAQTPDGLERIEVEVLSETRDIQGVAATVVRDSEYMDGELTEDTWDWFAQDDEGNVWYLGEDTCEYEGGECVNTGGTWEWGVGGALPGVVMFAEPAVDGRRYYQEYLAGEAEDVGEVVAVDVSVSDYAGCITTRETSTLDPELDELKHYCPGVGLVLVEEPDFEVQLVQTSL